MHDPRIGRFFAVDPLAPKYPHYSPYMFSGNRVIDRVELEGAETDIPPYLWSSTYGYKTKVYENGRTAHLVAGKWHTNVHAKCILYYNGKKWVPNPNHTSNEQYIREHGYEYTKKELHLLEKAGLANYKLDLWARSVMENPRPVTMETIRMYEVTFGVDLHEWAKLKMIGVGVEAFTLGASGFKFKNNGGTYKRYNFQGLLTKKMITKIEINMVEKHVSQFNAKENDVMISRMKKIHAGEMKATDIDINYKNHELREIYYVNKGMTQEEAHIQTLKDQGIYHKNYEF